MKQQSYEESNQQGSLFQQQQQPDDANHHHHLHTYVAGESNHRLNEIAASWGLSEPRRRRKPVREWFADSVSMHMHTVGALSRQERLDPMTGMLHYVTVRRRKRRLPAPPQYDTLTDLFHPPRVLSKVSEMEEEEIIEDIIVGGDLSAAVFGIIKGTVGPAILYLPHGVVQSGYAIAIPAILFATAMYLYSANACLLECWAIESRKQHEIIIMATTTVQEEEMLALVSSPMTTPMTTHPPPLPTTLLTYPELARRGLGPYAVLTVIGIVLFQLGVCLTYLMFVPQNLVQCFPVPRKVLVWAMVVGEIPFGWMSDIRSLTVTNIVATILIAYGLVAVLSLACYQGFQRHQHNDDGNSKELEFVYNWKQLPPITEAWFLFVGTSFFMMEGSITLVVPLQEAVASETDRKRFPAVNAKTTWGIVVFYIVFSCVCEAGFGRGLQTALTASLHGYIASSVQLAYSVAVFFTFPLQAFPALQVTCRAFLGDKPSPRLRSLLTTVITLLLGVIATIAMDYLGNVVSLLGSLFGIPLALVFPPLIHNRLVGSRIMTNYAVVAVGLFAMGATSYATAVSWNSKGGE